RESVPTRLASGPRYTLRSSAAAPVPAGEGGGGAGRSMVTTSVPSRAASSCASGQVGAGPSKRAFHVAGQSAKRAFWVVSTRQQKDGQRGSLAGPGWFRRSRACLLGVFFLCSSVSAGARAAEHL